MLQDQSMVSSDKQDTVSNREASVPAHSSSFRHGPSSINLTVTEHITFMSERFVWWWDVKINLFIHICESECLGRATVFLNEI